MTTALATLATVVASTFVVPIRWLMVAYTASEILFAVAYHVHIFPRANERISRRRERRGRGRAVEDRRSALHRRIMTRMRHTWCADDDDDEGEEFVPAFAAFVKRFFLPDPTADRSSPPPALNDDWTPTRGDVDAFLSWSFFDKRPNELAGWELEELAAMHRTEREFGVRWSCDDSSPPGGAGRTTPGVRPTLLSVDDATARYRPLLFYALFFVARAVGQAALLALGFSHRSTEVGLRYWYRPEQRRRRAPDDDNDDNGERRREQRRSPLLFFHGIAPGGVVNYLGLVLGGLARDGRAIFLFENPCISCGTLRTDVALSEDETCDGVVEAVERELGASNDDGSSSSSVPLTVAGHSFGSCVVTWLLNDDADDDRRPSSFRLHVHHVVLLDPVSILMYYPDTFQNFLYQRRVESAADLAGAAISTEVLIERYLRRETAWYNCELWTEDVPDSVAITACLSGKDGIVNTAIVDRELTLSNETRAERRNRKRQPGNGENSENGVDPSRPIQILRWPESGHGKCVVSPSHWEDVRRAIERQDALCEKEKSL